MIREKRPALARSEGFSLVEMLIVVVLIVIVGGFIVPPIMNYLRSSRIQGTANSVAGEIQTARLKAISNNVNLGVLFAVQSTTTYGWAIEDDLDPATAPNWTTIATEDWPTMADPTTGQTPGVRTLPDGIVFDDPAACLGGGAATDWGIRFRRLGTACNFSGAGCPVGPVPIPPSLIQATGGEYRFCLFDDRTGLRWTIRVTSSGRIITERGNP